MPTYAERTGQLEKDSNRIARTGQQEQARQIRKENKTTMTGLLRQDMAPTQYF
jgi:hypothetical protein